MKKSRSVKNFSRDTIQYGNKKGDRAMTTFEDLKPLFHQMSHSELQKTADWLVPDASDIAILTRAWDIKNHTERHM